VETAADAKQETRRQVCFREIRAHVLRCLITSRCDN
jgi:hypothetical protein